MSTELPWSFIAKYREQVAQEYPSLWQIEVVRSVMDKVRTEVRSDDAVLDIGASHHRLERALMQSGFRGIYRSMDVDTSTQQDYYSLDKVTETFDVAALIEVIEHIPEAVYLDLLGDVSRILKKGGKLIVTTPNIYHPYAFHLGGPSHISAYPYEEMAAMALSKGYRNIRLYRACADESFKWRMAVRVLAPFLNKYLGVDYARHIVMVCER